MRDKTPLYLLMIAVILAGVAGVVKGPQALLGGLEIGWKIFASVIPLLVAAFLVAGLAQVLASEEMVTKWLGAASGWKGIAIACVGGALIPGGPYVYYPIAAVLLHTGASLGVLVAFVLAKNLWSVSLLPMQLALLGPDLTITRYLVTFILPPLLGFLAEALFGGRLERIRMEAPKP